MPRALIVLVVVTGVYVLVALARWAPNRGRTSQSRKPPGWLSGQRHAYEWASTTCQLSPVRWSRFSPSRWSLSARPDPVRDGARRLPPARTREGESGAP